MNYRMKMSISLSFEKNIDTAFSKRYIIDNKKITNRNQHWIVTFRAKPKLMKILHTCNVAIDLGFFIAQ